MCSRLKSHELWEVCGKFCTDSWSGWVMCGNFGTEPVYSVAVWALFINFTTYWTTGGVFNYLAVIFVCLQFLDHAWVPHPLHWTDGWRTVYSAAIAESARWSCRASFPPQNCSFVYLCITAILLILQIGYTDFTDCVYLPSVLWRCWLVGRKGIRPVKNWVVGFWRGCLSGARWCHCHSLSLAPVKSRLVLPFWYRLIWVVPDKGPLNGCVCTDCVFVCHRKFIKAKTWSCKNSLYLLIFIPDVRICLWVCYWHIEIVLKLWL